MAAILPVACDYAELGGHRVTSLELTLPSGPPGWTSAAHSHLVVLVCWPPARLKSDLYPLPHLSEATDHWPSASLSPSQASCLRSPNCLIRPLVYNWQPVCGSYQFCQSLAEVPSRLSGYPGPGGLLGLTLGWEVLGLPCTIRRTGFQGSPGPSHSH